MNHFRERLRYENEITNCLTGDRIIICQGPLSQDIPRSITIGKYRATVMYRDQPSTSSRQKKCSKCLADGHNFSNCPNDWVCKSCGKEGHKQIDCVENDLSDNTQHPNEQQSTNENTNDAEGTTEENDTTQQPNHTDDPSTKSEHESTSVHEEDIDMSQLVTSLEAEQRKKKKSKKERKTKQTQITSFVSEQQESVSTPAKQKTNRNVERSPVTPTHVLHDNEGDTTAKRSKTLAT
ncbi:Hypothetical predicted protein [Mytilus galloprovincialis]|uniref:CCHC-type domain-containing protein n=1 Tax=Mytilus galloprovincialis TaxID=29158 RepID=A0A8B6DUI9_MYTGA|nr:Hypothetical predicted protein [Mytilus galloprovincialis]